MRPGVLITGGAKRIGHGLSHYFAQKGYDIALHYNSSADAAQALQKEINALGVSCQLFGHDLCDIGGIAPLLEKVHKAMPGCVGLINNASVFERGELMVTDEALFDRQMTVNLKAPFFLSQQFARYFKGSVVNILDSDIVQNNISHFAYLLSKKSLGDFTQMAARALGPDVRVNAVCPGCILPSIENDTSYEEKMEAIIPLHSHPGVLEVAEAVYWLMQQQHITGQVIFVDGGKHVL
jgi:NAD(P)-dependent dehydrogenase (short-subunit alcohol dehydrogenase family)